MLKKSWALFWDKKIIGKQANMESHEIWETVKLQCAEVSQQFARNVSKSKKELLLDLYKYQEVAKEQEWQTGVSTSLEQKLAVEQKIKEIEEERVQESSFRSRSQWQWYGCKHSKYFLSLEKRNYNNKTMFAILLDSGEICKEQKRILNEQARFYQELYATNPKIAFVVKNETDVKLNHAHVQQLIQPITINEMYQNLKSMPSGKVCGLDGLPTEFYLKFWEDIKEILHSTYLELMARGKLTRTMRKGVITLIPKKNKDPRRILNQRPLTLLSTDFKILAKIMATRIKEVLPDFVTSEQTRFMANRSIYDNIRKTIDIIADVNRNKRSVVIVSIDFEKCFDRIEHAGIYAALDFFRFPEQFITWTKTFFNELLICTQNAGYLSPFFHKTRGVNQGCPYLPFCYNVIGAVMSLLIRHNPHIQGVKLGKVQAPQVITQFADDTGLYLHYSKECIDEVIGTLMHVEQNTGLV